MNADGTIASVTDNGGTISYVYHQSGGIETISATGGKSITFGYDSYGRQTSVHDPSYGNVTYTYNDFGELMEQTTPKATFNLDYDILGRISSVSTTTFSQAYTYDTRKTGMISSIDFTEGSNSSSTDYYYDALSRINSVTESHSGRSFTTDYTYNTYGQAASLTYPNGFSVNYTYQNGQLQYVRRGDNNALIWQGINQHPNGGYTGSAVGNGLTTEISYNNYNFVTGISALHPSTGTYVMNQSYTWDMLHEQLTGRSDLLKSLSESFTYDNLGRLKTFTDAQSVAHTMQYDNNGNIDTKYDAGDYSYSAARPGAVEEIDAVAGAYALLSETQEVDYTDYDKVKEITEGTEEMDIYYGPGYFRTRTELYANSAIEKTKLFALGGLYEVEIDAASNERELCYINGGTGLCAIYEAESSAGSMYYTHTDYQGSIQVITDANRNIVQENSFDPWGRRRNPANWTYNSIPAMTLCDRGYTMHEHLDDFGLINMNGRMYDPLAGRFLSPDIITQNVTNTQSFNNYSYCVNNPLKYFDPSGYYIPAMAEAPFPDDERRYGSGGGRGSSIFSKMCYGLIDGPGFEDLYVWMEGTEGAWVKKSDVITFTGDDALVAFDRLTNGFDLYEVKAYNKVHYVLAPAGKNYNLNYFTRSHVATDAGVTAIEALGIGDIDNFFSFGSAANSGGSGKEIYDGFMFVSGLKATGASLLLDSRLARLNMYRPIMTTGGRTLYGGTSLYSSTLKLSQGVKGVGFGLAGLGVLYDYTIGIQRYNKYGANDPWAVSPNKAAVNTGVTAWSLFVSPPVGVLYFGIDAFYPGGWPEAMRVYTSEHKLYREIYGDRYSIDAIMKF